MIRNIHNKMTAAKAWTKAGVQYDMGGSRASGSADTSLFNSIDNAYVAYCAFRNANLDPDAAYRSLGLYGGDDGLTPDLEPAVYERTSNDLGLRLKATTHPSGARTGMLGRVYPAPADGPEQMADLPRQLGKLHVIASRDPMAARTVLVDRAHGILVTDPDTPILSNWARLVLRTHADHGEVKDRAVAYTLAAYRAAVEDGGVIDTPPMRLMLEEAVLSLGLSAVEITQYCALLDAATVFEYPPIKAPPKLVLPPGVAIGDLYTPPSPLFGHAGDLKRSAPRVVEYDALVRDGPKWPVGQWWKEPDADRVATKLCVAALALPAPADQVVLGCVPVCAFAAVRAAGYGIAVITIPKADLARNLLSRSDGKQPGVEILDSQLQFQEIALVAADVTLPNFAAISTLPRQRWFVWAASGAGKTTYLKTLVPAAPVVTGPKRDGKPIVAITAAAIIAGKVPQPVGPASFAFSALKPCVDCNGKLDITPAQLVQISKIPKAVPPVRCKKCKTDKKKRLAERAAEIPGI
jgi:hypothetical protein